MARSKSFKLLLLTNWDLKICDVLVCFLLVNVASICASRNSFQPEKKEVYRLDIKPGAGRQEVRHELFGVTCQFAYKAQGGTSEEWAVIMMSNKDHTELTCSVERPSGQSYLFFEEFKLLVSGATLKETYLEKQPSVPLGNSEYIVVMDSNYVQQRDGKFNSQLTKVEVYATRERTEL